MALNGPDAAVAAEPQLVITRVFAAPRELVFQAFTSAEHLNQWWGPKEATINAIKVDFRPGGEFHYSMKFPGQPEMWGRFAYREIVAPERLVWVNSFADAQGNVAPNPWLPDFPLEILNHLSLEETEGRTTLTLRGGPLDATPEQDEAYVRMFQSMNQGFKGTFDRLDEFLREIVLTRVFDAPRDLVFKAWIDAAQVSQWWGPDGFTIKVHEMDVRPGGLWRFLMHHEKHGDFADRVVYREVTPPERLAFDHGSDPFDGSEFAVTVTFEEVAGKTRVTQTLVFATAHQREEVKGFGAVEMGNQTFQHLADYLARL